MTFADPIYFALLAAIPVLLYLSSRLRLRSAPAAFPNVGLFSGYRRSWRVRFRWAPTAVRAVALALFVIALAKPQTGQAQSELPGHGIDIALVLDTSGSMTTSLLSNDTRLQAAEKVLGKFIEGRPDDRMGLVIFRSDSLVVSPMTLDHQALLDLLPQVDNVNLADGTAIGLGLSDALNLLRDSRARSRVAVLLTDGENNAGNVDPLQAARIAQTMGVRVYTIGVIDPRARKNGASDVDEKALQSMADVTGGKYFSADSEEALSNIYKSIDSLEKSRVGRVQFAAYNELAIYFLAAGLGLLALEAGLRASVWRTAS